MMVFSFFGGPLAKHLGKWNAPNTKQEEIPEGLYNNPPSLKIENDQSVTIITRVTLPPHQQVKRGAPDIAQNHQHPVCVCNRVLCRLISQVTPHFLRLTIVWPSQRK